jgi:uncharacterized protein
MNIVNKYKDKLISIIHSHIPGCTIYLFGSRAVGEHSQGSDIDLAVDSIKKISHSDLIKILLDIEETTIPVKVDLINIQDASIEIKNEILKKGIKWTN